MAALSPDERALRDKRILELREQGLTHREIAVEVGLAHSTVGRVLDPDMAERRREEKRQWSKDNIEHIRVYQKQYDQDNYERDREHRTEYWREYREKNAERLRVYWRQWYNSNLDLHRENIRKWREKNPERRRDHHRKRRAIKRRVPSHTIDEKILIALYPFCGLCGDDFEPGDRIHIDHIIPLSKGGWHTWANVQPAHASCNTSKGNRYDPTDPKVKNIKFKGLTNFERDYLAEDLEKIQKYDERMYA